MIFESFHAELHIPGDEPASAELFFLYTLESGARVNFTVTVPVEYSGESTAYQMLAQALAQCAAVADTVASDCRSSSPEALRKRTAERTAEIDAAVDIG